MTKIPLKSHCDSLMHTIVDHMVECINIINNEAENYNTIIDKGSTRAEVNASFRRYKKAKKEIELFNTAVLDLTELSVELKSERLKMITELMDQFFERTHVNPKRSITKNI